LIEIEFTTDSTRVLPSGNTLREMKCCEKPSAQPPALVEWSEPVLESMDKPPGPARPSLVQKNRYSSNANTALLSEF